MVEGMYGAGRGAKSNVSIRRADYWLVEGRVATPVAVNPLVSIRRADYWLVEVVIVGCCATNTKRFNPPGGLLVG